MREFVCQDTLKFILIQALQRALSHGHCGMLWITAGGKGIDLELRRYVYLWQW